MADPTTEQKSDQTSDRTDSSGEGRLRVSQVRSSIGTKPNHRANLKALGLGRIGKSNNLPDRPEIRGMIARVPHLVTVEPIGNDEVAG